METPNIVETETKRRNIPTHRFLTNDIVTDIDIKKTLKINDEEIIEIVGKTICDNDNIDDLIEKKKQEQQQILEDLSILTAESEIEKEL
jgi:propanediol dehydratase large subunit